MIFPLRCPHCKGRVGPLMGGMRQSYCGRQRLCLRCGTIWRMNEVAYAFLVGTALLAVAAGIVAFYWRLKPVEADWYSLAWVAGWLVLFWPLLYYVVWWVKVRR